MSIPEKFQFKFSPEEKNLELWAFTVKILKVKNKNITQKDYGPFFKVLYNLSRIITYCGEVDSKGILHYHGVIELSPKFYRKNLGVKGYHIRLTRIYDLQKWIEYCFKNNFEVQYEQMLRNIGESSPVFKKKEKKK